DLFFDAKRQRVYLSCGDGYLDVFEAQGDGYRRSAHLPTISGARTSLFIPELDRLFVAARANPDEPAALWVFRLAPQVEAQCQPQPPPSSTTCRPCGQSWLSIAFSLPSRARPASTYGDLAMVTSEASPASSP